MKVIDWVWCIERSMAKRVCNRLVKIGARIINIDTTYCDGTTVWFDHEGELDRSFLEGLKKEEVTT